MDVLWNVDACLTRTGVALTGDLGGVKGRGLDREGWLSSEGLGHIGQRESDPRIDCLAISKAATASKTDYDPQLNPGVVGICVKEEIEETCEPTVRSDSDSQPELHESSDDELEFEGESDDEESRDERP